MRLLRTLQNRLRAGKDDERRVPRQRPAGSDHDQLDPEYDGMPQPPGVLEQKEELAKLVKDFRG